VTGRFGCNSYFPNLLPSFASCSSHQITTYPHSPITRADIPSPYFHPQITRADTQPPHYHSHETLKAWSACLRAIAGHCARAHAHHVLPTLLPLTKRTVTMTLPTMPHTHTHMHNRRRTCSRSTALVALSAMMSALCWGARWWGGRAGTGVSPVPVRWLV